MKNSKWETEIKPIEIDSLNPYNFDAGAILTNNNSYEPNIYSLAETSINSNENFEISLTTDLFVKTKEKYSKKISASSIEKEAENKSNYIVTSGGDLGQTWNSITYIPCKLIEINENSILLECIILDKNNTIEVRAFDRSFLSKKVALNDNFILKIFKAEGIIKFEIDLDLNQTFSKKTSHYYTKAKEVSWGKLKK